MDRVEIENWFRCGICQCYLNSLSNYQGHFLRRHPITKARGATKPSKGTLDFFLQSVPEPSHILTLFPSVVNIGRGQASTAIKVEGHDADGTPEIELRSPTIFIREVNPLKSLENIPPPPNASPKPINKSKRRYNRKKLPNQPYIHQCELCGKSFKANAFLERHIITWHTKEKAFSCDHCEKCFSRKDSLKQHMRMHSDKNFYNCEHCDRAFRFRSCLHRHISLEHTEDGDRKQFQCPDCPSYFFSKGKLDTHRQNAHGIEKEKKFKCDLCSKRFVSHTGFKNHILLHTAEKHFKCDLCPKSFTQNSNLTTHKKIHIEGNRPRPFSCEKCEKTFVEKSAFTFHMKTVHDKEENFWCSICNQGFAYNSLLVAHFRKHVEERTQNCEFCEKAFKDVGSLRMHMKLHLEEKHYSCGKCGKAFVQEGNLITHRRKCGKMAISKRKEGVENSWNIY